MPETSDPKDWAKFGFDQNESVLWLKADVFNPVVAAALDARGLRPSDVKTRKLPKIAQKAELAGVWNLIFNNTKSGKPLRIAAAGIAADKKV